MEKEVRINHKVCEMVMTGKITRDSFAVYCMTQHLKANYGTFSYALLQKKMNISRTRLNDCWEELRKADVLMFL